MTTPARPEDAPTLLAALEATPLLGRGLDAAEALRAAIHRQLASHPDPVIALRQRLQFGALLLVRESAEAEGWLRAVAQDATAREQRTIAQRALLMAVRARCVAGAPEAGATLLEEIERSSITAASALDHLLARAWIGTLDSVGLLREALDRIPASRDHDRLAVLLELADRCEAGSDPHHARDALEQALALAQAHGAHSAAARAALMLGALLLRTGAPALAAIALDQALAAGASAGDTLAQASAGALSVALLLGQGAWQPLLTRSAPLMEVARARHNGALLASLTLDRATAHVHLDHPDLATRELLTVGRELELGGHEFPLNLIKARLVALLKLVGPERFGALVIDAMGAGAPPPGRPT